MGIRVQGSGAGTIINSGDSHEKEVGKFMNSNLL